MGAILQNSLNFLHIAAENASRISVSRALEPNHPEALISIIFAASALEAFINERVEMAALLCEISHQEVTIQHFAAIMADAERLPLCEKYRIARRLLCEDEWNSGSNPYQDFSLLVDLRNSLVHLKPSPKVIEKLRSKNVLAHTAELTGNVSGGWTISAATKEMADWACHAAAEFVATLLDCAAAKPGLTILMPTTKEYFSELLPRLLPNRT